MAEFEWHVPFIVVAVIGVVLYLSGRSKAEPKSGPSTVSSPAELMDRLQRTLGIAILVESVESVEAVEPLDAGEPASSVVIRATFMFGRYTTHVIARGASEAAAWEDLARAAIAWRNSDYQHIPMWWGAGG